MQRRNCCRAPGVAWLGCWHKVTCSVHLQRPMCTVIAHLLKLISTSISPCLTILLFSTRYILLGMARLSKDLEECFSYQHAPSLWYVIHFLPPLQALHPPLFYSFPSQYLEVRRPALDFSYVTYSCTSFRWWLPGQHSNGFV